MAAPEQQLMKDLPGPLASQDMVGRPEAAFAGDHTPGGHGDMSHLLRDLQRYPIDGAGGYDEAPVMLRPVMPDHSVGAVPSAPVASAAPAAPLISAGGSMLQDPAERPQISNALEAAGHLLYHTPFGYMADRRTQVVASATCNLMNDYGNVGPTGFLQLDHGNWEWATAFGVRGRNPMGLLRDRFGRGPATSPLGAAFDKAAHVGAGYLGAVWGSDPSKRTDLTTWPPENIPWNVTPFSYKTKFGTYSLGAGTHPALANGAPGVILSKLNAWTATAFRDGIWLSYNWRLKKRFKLRRNRIVKRIKWLKKFLADEKGRDNDIMCGGGLMLRNPDFRRYGGDFFFDTVAPQIVWLINYWNVKWLGKKPVDISGNPPNTAPGGPPSSNLAASSEQTQAGMTPDLRALSMILASWMPALGDFMAPEEEENEQALDGRDADEGQEEGPDETISGLDLEPLLALMGPSGVAHSLSHRSNLKLPGH